MKKMNLILSGSLLVMSLGVLSPAVVYAGAETETAQEDENGEMSWVFDDCGILSDDEITELNDELATIYDTYGYDAVLWISQDVGEDEDYRQYAAEFMQANEIGYGDTHEGMCIFHQPGVTLRSYSAETRRMSFLRESRMKCWINVRHILRMMIHSVDISH